MSLIESLHQARRARLRRIAARAVAQAPQPGSKARRELDRDYERAWAVEMLGLVPRRPRRPGIEEIQRAVARHFGVRCVEIAATHRLHAARPRQVAMYLAKVLTTKSLSEIGRCFARDHSTVLHAVRRIESLLAQDDELVASVDCIRDMLDG